MRSLLIIKLGGSVITDKDHPCRARRGVIRRLGREIIASSYKGDLIIVHGSGSFGHTAAARYKNWADFPAVADAARAINEIVIDELLKIKLPVVSFSPLSFILAKDTKPAGYFLEPLGQALLQGLIPCTYGDVVINKKGGLCIFSGERIIALLVEFFYWNYQIEVRYITDTEGVLDAKGKLVPVVTESILDGLKDSITGSKAVDVTGGMLHKVQESLLLARRYGVAVRIGRTVISV